MHTQYIELTDEEALLIQEGRRGLTLRALDVAQCYVLAQHDDRTVRAVALATQQAACIHDWEFYMRIVDGDVHKCKTCGFCKWPPKEKIYEELSVEEAALIKEHRRRAAYFDERKRTQAACGHDWRDLGHGHNDTHYECTKCGLYKTV